MDRPDLFRWLQGTAALAVTLTVTYTNLVHENTVRKAIALMLLLLGTIIKSPGHAREKGPEKHSTREQQAQNSSRYLPSERSVPVGLTAGCLLHKNLNMHL